MSEALITVLDWVAILCIFAGAALSLVAGAGLLRFPDLLSRMHTAAKPQVLGLLLVLVGIGIRLIPVETDVFSVGTLFLVGFFQMLTIPVAGHIVTRLADRTERIDAGTVLRHEMAEHIEARRAAEKNR